MSALPESAYPRCIVCGKPVERVGLYAITGYEEPRTAGGANQIIRRERTGGIVGTCCELAVKAGRENQGTLL